MPLCRDALSLLKVHLRLWSADILKDAENDEMRDERRFALARHIATLEDWSTTLENGGGGSRHSRTKYDAETLLHAFRASRLLRKESWLGSAFRRLIEVRWPNLFGEEELASGFMSASTTARAGFVVDMALVLHEQARNKDRHSGQMKHVPFIYRFKMKINSYT